VAAALACSKFFFSSSWYLYLPSPILNNCYILVVIRQENILPISMRFNLQWNLGRNITSCPLLLINSSTIETWFLKSSWWFNNCAMQQFLVFQARDVTSLFLPGRYDRGSQDALLINKQLYVAWECKRTGRTLLLLQSWTRWQCDSDTCDTKKNHTLIMKEPLVEFSWKKQHHTQFIERSL
jgi:hypothetical protein